MFKLPFAKIIFTIVVYIVLGTLTGVQFLPLATALKLVLVLPLMFFLPGYLVAPLCFKTLDQPERICWAFFLSLTLLYLTLHPVELINGRLTSNLEILTIASINAFSICLALIYRWKKGSR